MTTLGTRPEWAEVIAEHAVDEHDRAAPDRAARSRSRCRRSRSAGCSSAGRAARPSRRRPAAPGGAAAGGRPRRDGAAGPRAAARPLPARARGRPGRGALVVRRAGAGRARRLGAGARRAGVASRRTASRRPTSSSRCSCGRSKGSRPTVRCAVGARRELALGRACSTCARTCSAARWTTCAPSPRRRPSLARRRCHKALPPDEARRDQSGGSHPGGSSTAGTWPLTARGPRRTGIRQPSETGGCGSFSFAETCPSACHKPGARTTSPTADIGSARARRAHRRRLDQPRPRRPRRAAAARRGDPRGDRLRAHSRAARARTRRSPPRGSAHACSMVGAVGDDALADEALAGLAERGSSSTSSAPARPGWR